MLNRRSFSVGILLTAVVAPEADGAIDVRSEIAALEASFGGRIGVAALDTGSGRWINHRADERFAMCSTFKWLLAAAVLSRCDGELLRLDKRVVFAAKDLPSHSPVTRGRLGEGGMTIAELCAAAVEESDNGAANLLLGEIGGPRVVTAYARSSGDTVTRLDRTELALNENLPGDPRDTTTPNAMVSTMQRVLLGDVLSPKSRAQLTGWMKNCRTGFDRLRAGLPKHWTVADKTGTGTGTGRTSAANDVAVAWPPGKPPILIASYISGSSAPLGGVNGAHAHIGRLVASMFG